MNQSHKMTGRIQKKILSKVVKLGSCPRACTFPILTPLVKKYDYGILPKPEKIIVTGLKILVDLFLEILHISRSGAKTVEDNPMNHRSRMTTNKPATGLKRKNTKNISSFLDMNFYNYLIFCGWVKFFYTTK